MSDEIYADKTQLAYELASRRRKFFLARPRRFGKSLLISTFESLFKYGLRDSQGLAIEKQWKEEKTYNVVRLEKIRKGVEKLTVKRGEAHEINLELKRIVLVYSVKSRQDSLLSGTKLRNKTT